MVRWLGLALIAAVAACSAPSDGGTCPQGGSLEVTVTDEDSGSTICDASVTIAPAAGGTAKTLAPEAMMTPGCNYFILVTPGQYTITASRSGYVSGKLPLTVTTDGCTIESPTVEIPLLEMM